MSDLREQLRALVILDEVGSDNPLGRDAADEITRLMEDLEQSVEHGAKGWAEAASLKAQLAEAEADAAKANDNAVKAWDEREHYREYSANLDKAAHALKAQLAEAQEANLANIAFAKDQAAQLAEWEIKWQRECMAKVCAEAKLASASKALEWVFEKHGYQHIAGVLASLTDEQQKDGQ